MQKHSTKRDQFGSKADMREKQQWSVDDMEARVVRYADLRPCYNAFIDTRTPGSEAKENFTIIGPGVSENPDQYVHIAEPHGFNIGGARQPPGCMATMRMSSCRPATLFHCRPALFAGLRTLVTMLATFSRCWAATIPAGCCGHRRSLTWRRNMDSSCSKMAY
jgi:hypothetical protein